MKLSSKDRGALPPSKFAGPGRSFPIPDKSHARAAISGATRSQNAGNISPSTAAVVKSKAHKMLATTPANNAEGNRASLHFAAMKAMGK